MALVNEVARCRTGVANLLAESVAMTRKLERRLGVTGGWSEAAEQFDLNADPTAALRIMCALLLRKARLHSEAVLRANKISNLHSLAVQMRPALECAGQIVFFFYNLIIAPDLTMSRDSALSAVSDYLNSAGFRKIIEMTRDNGRRKELLGMISETEAEAAVSVGMPKPKKRRSRSYNLADKVALLPEGKKWYSHLSDYFTHSKKADLKGLSYCGGVISNSTIADGLAFLEFMSYLANQLAFMNSAAALCPVSGDADDQWDRWVEPALVQLRNVRESSDTFVEAAKVAVTGEQDGDSQID